MDNPDFLSEVKASNSVKFPAGHWVQLRFCVKVQSNNKEQAVCFVPKASESYEELAFSETVSNIRRGRMNYVIVDVLNQTKEEKILFIVAAVIPRMKFKNNCDGEKDNEEKSATVGSVTKDSEEGTDVKKTSSLTGDKKDGEVPWDLSHLTGEQRDMVEKVLLEERDVFAKDEHDIRDLQDFQIPINLVDDFPVTTAYRRIPPHLYTEIKNYINDLVTNGWICEFFVV